VIGTYVGENPTLRAGTMVVGFDGFGGTGDITCSPSGVIDPRRGCCVCIYKEGCATAMTEGIAGADDGVAGGDGLRNSVSHHSRHAFVVTQSSKSWTHDSSPTPS